MRPWIRRARQGSANTVMNRFISEHEQGLLREEEAHVNEKNRAEDELHRKCHEKKRSARRK